MLKCRIFTLSACLEIRKGDKLFLNTKRIELLRQLRQGGSIQAAAMAMHISYQLAWNYINEINSLSPVPIVVRKRGGADGGGAELTKYGAALVGNFMRMQEMHHDYLQTLESTIDGCLL
ncbi:MAG: LysR family transcriptional regulator [Dysgonamonadaceae bacterium]|jgi:molybdate transport system regulatory protein|nr:LysR family transcriptional regulator [Dysgonamonadaceae bacterium]